MSRPKGVCSVCGEQVTQRKDGLIRAHGYQRGGPGPALWCPGSEKDPRTSSDGAYSAICERAGCDRLTQAIVWTNQHWLSLCAVHTKKALTKPRKESA